MDLNFKEMCRLCARKCEDMQNIFQDIPAETEIYVDVTKELSSMLAFKITNATSIKVFKENCRSIAVRQPDVNTCSKQGSSMAVVGCAPAWGHIRVVVLQSLCRKKIGLVYLNCM